MTDVSSTSFEHDPLSEHITFEYTWTVRIVQRMVENGSLVLNVSPPFSTSHNSVAFTWALRLSDEYMVASGAICPARHVALMLYYKDGPSCDVQVDEARIDLADTDGSVIMDSLLIGENEWTKGSGWPVRLEPECQRNLTDSIHQRIDANITVTVYIKMHSALFQPLSYLPSLDSRSERIQKACFKALDKELNEVHERTPTENEGSFESHRLAFLRCCDAVEQDCGNDNDAPELLQKIRNVSHTFAHVYFERVLLRDVKCFEDFVALMENIHGAHIPPLKRECERFICREVMSKNADPAFVQKMLLLSETFSLNVLKMVAGGVLADQIVAHEDPTRQLVTIKHQLEHIASQINNASEDAVPSEEALVDNVLGDLQSLARRIRRVSLSHSPTIPSASSSSSGSTPQTPTANMTTPPSFQPSSPNTSRFKKVEIES